MFNEEDRENILKRICGSCELCAVTDSGKVKFMAQLESDCNDDYDEDIEYENIEDLRDIVSQVIHDNTWDISVIEDEASVDSVESINCPYCGKTIVGLPELHEVGNHIITCPNCHNKFILKTSISYHYDVSERMEIANNMKESTNV